MQEAGPTPGFLRLPRAVGKAGGRAGNVPPEFGLWKLWKAAVPVAGPWWAMTGSNRRPSRCKRDALPTELIAPAGRTFKRLPCASQGPTGARCLCGGPVALMPASFGSGLVRVRGRVWPSSYKKVSTSADSGKAALDTQRGTPYPPRDDAREPVLTSSAGVAQSVRVPACHAGGRGFEPRHSRHFSRSSRPISRPGLSIQTRSHSPFGVQDDCTFPDR
jgi:hypothetical protein